MLLGTFKTVFNSVFLVPTKTNTPYHMAKKQRVRRDKRKKERDRDRDREDFFSTKTQEWLGFS